MKRSTRFWRKNERQVMERLGFTPTVNSGAGWIEKGDGQSEFCICELKSTDSLSYRLCLDDLHKIEEIAIKAHKTPILAVQYLGSGEVYLVIKPAQIEDVAAHFRASQEDMPTPRIVFDERDGILDGLGETICRPITKVSSSQNDRDDINDELSIKYKKQVRYAK